MMLRGVLCLGVVAGLAPWGSIGSLHAQTSVRDLASDPSVFTVAATPRPLALEPALWSGERTTLWRSVWGAAAASAVAYGFLHDETVIECGAPASGDRCPSGFVLSERTSQPHRTAGLVAGGVALLAGWLHTRGGSDGAGVAEARVAPRVHGPGRVSLVQFPLPGGSR